MLDVFASGLLGIANGARHALEPDHVSAVATVVVGRPSARTSVAYAAAWGIGHGVVIVILGALALLAGARVPDSAAEGLEILVAAMLVVLGLRAWRTPPALKPGEAARVSTRRSLVIGCVHGLAGSGAVMALAIGAGSGSTRGALVGITLYAGGAAVGMMLLAGACGSALARLVTSPRAAGNVAKIAGMISVAVGAAWAIRAVVRLAG